MAIEAMLTKDRSYVFLKGEGVVSGKRGNTAKDCCSDENQFRHGLQ